MGSIWFLWALFYARNLSDVIQYGVGAFWPVIGLAVGFYLLKTGRRRQRPAEVAGREENNLD